MKKLIPFFALVLLLTALVFSSEAVDVKVADVYSTSILATVDGHPIPSYNIGGFTCVCLEDLQYYGFDVIWDPVNGIISATSSDKPADYSVFANVERGVPGTVIGAVYQSAIQAEVNGKYIASYNIGGYTCVCIETLGDMAYSNNAEYGLSQYYMSADWDPENGIIALNTFRCTPESENPFILAGLDYGCVYRVGDPYGLVQAGEDYYRDFRGAITSIIPLFFETGAGMTDILVGYASPFGVSFDKDAVQMILDEELWVMRDPQSLAAQAMEETDFEVLDYIDADDCVILYGCYTYSKGEELYSLRFFNSVGEVREMLEDLPGIDAAEREFPLEALDVNEGKTILTFSLIYDGRLYTYEIDLLTGELDMT